MSRPSTPPTMPGLVVDMGGLAFVSRATGAYTNIKGVGGYHASNGTIAQQDKRGMFTKGIAACFTVVVVGSGGAIMAHVSAYLAHPNLSAAHQAELKAMKDGFARLWAAHSRELSPTQVAIIPGEWTNEADMRRLYSHIFPQIPATAHKSEFPCKKTPFPRTAANGTATVLLAQAGNQIYVENVRKM